MRCFAGFCKIEILETILRESNFIIGKRPHLYLVMRIEDQSEWTLEVQGPQLVSKVVKFNLLTNKHKIVEAGTG